MREAGTAIRAANCPQQVLEEVLAAAGKVLGTVGGALLLLDAREEFLFLAGAHGLPEEFPLPSRAIDLEEDLTVTYSVRKDEAVWLDSFAERRSRYPLQHSAHGRDVVSGTLPLRSGAAIVGVLWATRTEERAFTGTERAVLECLADLAAEALCILTGRRTAPWESGDGPSPFVEDSVLEAGTAELAEFTWDLSTDVIRGDEALSRLHGIAHRPEGHPVEDLVAAILPADLPHVAATMARIRTECEDYQVPYRVLAGGRIRHLETRGRVAGTTAGGEPAAMRGVVADVTAAHARRAQAEQTLNEYVSQTRQLRELAAALAGAGRIDDLVRAARGALSMFGADGLLITERYGDRMHVAGSHGLDESELHNVRDFPITTVAPLSDALVRRVPVFMNDLDELLAVYPHLTDHAERLTRAAWTALPLPTSSGPQAACMIVFPHTYSFTPGRRALLGIVAQLLAQALDRARVYQAEHDLAVALQRDMLPTSLHQPTGTTVAAIYRPATAGLQVGGDWYDALPTPSGELALIVGDVQGHGVQAAAFMGRIRTAILAYTHEGHTPATVLARTNQLLVQLAAEHPADTALFATCSYGRLNPRTGRLTLVRAGHPPPLIHSPGGAVRALNSPGGLPLGLFPGQSYPTHRTTLPPGGLLLQYTDGLIENPGTDLDDGLQQLATALTQAPPELPGALEHILETCAPDLHRDDITALLTRHDPV
ncbi:GAF domain-containing SpoIIE family protein phosphatase [Actinocorallia longicatena]|uniref:Serine phosphatase RsbU (Regulator of sigma subunit) n=1 Tax=Actinocorallia longicatena TaxID=111803 RepID=A0ABP6QKY1_9ACTN